MDRSSAPGPRSAGRSGASTRITGRTPATTRWSRTWPRRATSLRLKNRPSNVHDSKQAVPFLRDIIDDLRARFGRRVTLEFRMDAAFFQRGILQLLAARDCGYAIKVGYWSWLPLKAMTAACRRWQPVAPGVTGYETELVIPQWQDLRLRVVLYRKHVHHETRRNFQLDLFALLDARAPIKGPGSAGQTRPRGSEPSRMASAMMSAALRWTSGSSSSFMVFRIRPAISSL